jgi:hypothetical protein
MKAKDYALKFLELLKSEDGKAVSTILVEFDQETAAIVRARGVKTDQSFKSVIQEMEDKWLAFVRIVGAENVPLKNPNNGYRDMMKILHPTTAAFAWPGE